MSQLVLGAHRGDLGVPLRKLGEILTQLRHTPLAVGSREATVEDQDHLLVALIFGQPHSIAFKTLQGKVWGQRVDLNSLERYPPLNQTGL